MIETIAIQTVILVAFIAFAGKRLMNYLHALQQDDYDNSRFIKWITSNKVFDTRVSLLLLVIFALGVFTEFSGFILNILVFLVFIFAAYFEKDPRKVSKKSLLLTSRASRILIASIAATLLFSLVFAYILPVIFWVIMVQLIPLMLIIGNASLAPREAVIQRRFYDDARARLDQINPTVIGITGSYGKTSVKHILGHILKRYAPTLMTPGSVNTIMGITRIIREQLAPNHKYFIVEMGAYGKGSIGALCDLTPPDFGIITSIGHAHYERFQSLEAVVEAKYELAQAVIAKHGTMIVHEKTLKFEHSRDIRHKAMDNFIACGEPMRTKKPKNKQEFSYLTDGDLKILSTDQTPKGIAVNIEFGGEKHTLRAPIYGVHHGHNIALAFACAMELGMEAKRIKTALASTPQIKHRLEVKRQIDGTTIIDDAYNSNPPGFRSALHVLGVLAKDSGRAVLITPGIVELGTAHDEVHKTLGALAAEICDVVIVVNPARIPTFIEGFHANHGKMLKEFDRFEQAQEWMFRNKQEDDVILLENDLPDIYERVLKI